jgi:hypothetical protein
MKHKLLATLLVCITLIPEINAQGVALLNVNDVQMRVYSNGRIGPDPLSGEPALVVPVSNGTGIVAASGLWAGGTSPDGSLKLAAHLYGDGTDFFPGPLTVTGDASITPAVSTAYDRVWTINAVDVDLHRAYFACLNDLGCDPAIAFPNGYTIPESFVTWPAQGDIGAGQAPYLAPFFDYNNDGTYDPANGDHPCVLGDQALYTIFNDKLEPHTESDGDVIGLEIHMMPFAYAQDPALQQTVFVQYHIVNRGTQTLENFHLGQFVDFDLGCGEDDFAGTDAQRSMIYAINGDADDQDCFGHTGFGTDPPAAGMVILKGAYLDPDGLDNAETIDQLYQYGTGFADGFTDNERFGLSGSSYWLRDGDPAITDPDTLWPSHYFNYLRGVWKNGAVQSYGGTGYSSDQSAIRSLYAFPGNSDPLALGTVGIPQAPWTETTATNLPGDRRMLASMGPRTLDHGSSINLLVAFVYARASPNSSQTSLEALQTRVDSVRAFVETIPGMFTSSDNSGSICNDFTSGVFERTKATNSLFLFPNPANDKVTIHDPNLKSRSQVQILDACGSLIAQHPALGPTTTIDVGDLPAGVYAIRIVDRGGAQVGRLVKE